MYSTCIFCGKALGSNEALEIFPVGRRLAFDAAKGRLWVVCPNCDRWNLTPLEERWEAIESAERLYVDSKQRVATENIGLARLPEGLDLVRIGRPQRPEMAAWRYGDQFGRRRRRAIVGGTLAVVTAGATGVLLLPVSGFLAGLATGLAGVGAFAGTFAGAKADREARFGRRWIPDDEGQYLLVTPYDVSHARLAGPGRGAGGHLPDAEWTLKVPYTSRRAAPVMRMVDSINAPSAGETTLSGAMALEAARKILPLVNGWGATGRQVQEAVHAIETWGGPERAFAEAAANVRTYAAQQTFGDTGALGALPPSVRLALEMAAHEEQEREALEGELARLEAVWREAEEIAAISDDMLVSSGVQAAFDKLRARIRGVSSTRD